MLKPGQQAPVLRLYARPRERIDLADHIGRAPVVLLFFPLAFSSTCTAEMCAVAEDWSAWSALGAHVFGISVDSPYVNVRFAESCNAMFPILSDFNREAIEAYDVVRNDLGGLEHVAERAVFVIDRDGKITYAWQGENPGVMPPFGAIRNAVAATE